MKTFRAIILNKDNNQVVPSIQDLPRDSLPEGDVLVKVAYSSLNYKDGLAVSGSFGVVRSYPMIPGVDLAGTVEESSSPDYQPGDQVVMTGCGAGDFHWGGYAQLARLKAEWLVPLPSGITCQQAMGVGTAGFTAMLSVMTLEKHGLKLNPREILVTGAAGGVGSVAVAILSKLGYRVVASTGRAETYDYLRALGAYDIIDRSALSEPSKKPLDSERWGGAIDSVGGQTLASVLRQLVYGASVTACGLVGGVEIPTTVLPFILRGVSLLGIDAVQSKPETRRAVWSRIARDLPMSLIDSMSQVATLEDVILLTPKILQGQVRGRTVIDVNR
ncbi:MAG: MDR family oxidoreductase [Pirellulaceae bacterium]|nr:MDR family oxidoreductase [Pirellulaceae bacterium]